LTAAACASISMHLIASIKLISDSRLNHLVVDAGIVKLLMNIVAAVAGEYAK
jgi:hypothetical protein